MTKETPETILGESKFRIRKRYVNDLRNNPPDKFYIGPCQPFYNQAIYCLHLNPDKTLKLETSGWSTEINHGILFGNRIQNDFKESAGSDIDGNFVIELFPQINNVETHSIVDLYANFIDEQKTEKILGDSNSIHEFCWEFTRNYDVLSPGIYTSPDGALKIEKTTIPDPTPSRVGHTSKIVQVQQNLEITTSSMLFLLIWCFIKGKDVHQPDDAVDIETFDICKTNLEWSMADFAREVVPMLRRVNNETNPKRISWIESILNQ